MKINLNEEAAVEYAFELTKLAIEYQLVNNYGNPTETADAVANFFNTLVTQFTTSSNN